MQEIEFIKMVASGNDFVLIGPFLRCPTRSLKRLAQELCNRKYGVGADGLLLLEKSNISDIKMRIFNADGSEAEMCGNGARCVALWVKSKISATNRGGFAKNYGEKNQKIKILKIETKAGIIASEINGDDIKIKLTDPKDIRLDISIKINRRPLRVNFINTGVPHTVIFVEGLDKIDVVNLGRYIRYHPKFSPFGTNVNFVEVLSRRSIKVRTYERGVEDETLACGTGAVASALLLATRYSLLATLKIDVLTKSGEILRVYFKKIGDKFQDVWLEGKVNIVYKGVYYVK